MVGIVTRRTIVRHCVSVCYCCGWRVAYCAPQSWKALDSVVSPRQIMLLQTSHGFRWYLGLDVASQEWLFSFPLLPRSTDGIGHEQVPLNHWTGRANEFLLNRQEAQGLTWYIECGRTVWRHKTALGLLPFALLVTDQTVFLPKISSWFLESCCQGVWGAGINMKKKFFF